MESVFQKAQGASDQGMAPTGATVIPRLPSRSRQCCQHVRRSALVVVGGGCFPDISTTEAFGNHESRDPSPSETGTG